MSPVLLVLYLLAVRKRKNSYFLHNNSQLTMDWPPIFASHFAKTLLTSCPDSRHFGCNPFSTSFYHSLCAFSGIRRSFSLIRLLVTRFKQRFHQIKHKGFDTCHHFDDKEPFVYSWIRSVYKLYLGQQRPVFNIELKLHSFKSNGVFRPPSSPLYGIFFSKCMERMHFCLTPECRVVDYTPYNSKHHRYSTPFLTS